MKKFFLLFLSVILLLMLQGSKFKGNDDGLKQKATELAHKFIIVDTHIDVPERLHEEWEDISQRTEKGNFDYPRAIKGGLNAAFMSIYIPAKYQETGGAKALADTLIDMVYKFTTEWSDKFSLAFSPADVVKQFSQNKISLCMGMENGAGIEGNLSNLKYFYDRGIRYITLTHSKNNKIGDSSYDEEPKWNGLSPFGKEVVKEMNRLGIMIDVSHITDSTFYDVMEISKAPVIASHSSCRYFTPDWERNMSDDQIKLLAFHGGVIQINFGSSFLRGDLREKRSEIWNEIDSLITEKGLDRRTPEGRKFVEEYWKEHNPGFADVKDVADHIDHVVSLVGIDYVGIGSDFDGVGDSLPTGLKDVSGYPNLIYELLKRGYSEDDIEKICGKNLLRVWKQVEETAKQLQSE